MHNVQTEFLRTRNVGDVINASLYFIRDHFKPIIWAILYIAGPLLLISIVAGMFYLSNEFSGSVTAFQPNMFGIGFLVTAFIANVSALVVTMLIMAIMYEYIFLCYNHGVRHYEVSEIWYAVKKRILFYLLYSVLAGIIIVIGYFFLILPGIYLTITLSFIYMIAFLEDKTFTESVSRCYDFIQGHWWNTFGLLLLIYIIYYVISMLFSMPALIYGIVIGILTFDGDVGNASLIITFLLSILGSVSYVAIILPVTAIAFQYFNIMERKYAPGLSRDIDNLKTAG